MSQAFEVAGKRTDAQIDQTNVKFSSYGQIHAGFSSLQRAGKALVALSKGISDTDTSNAAQGFVDAFNTTNGAVNRVIRGTSKNPGVLADDTVARISSNDLRRVVSSVSSAELKNAGISVNQNGSLSIDRKVLGNAVQDNPDAVKSTLAKLGQQATKTATEDLSSSGAVGKTVNSLNTQAKNLAARQTQEDSLMASAQAAIQQNANQFAGFSGSSSGTDVYAKIFSL